MTIDAIIGNPPYQIMDGGNNASAKPVYQHFVTLSKKLNPHYISMITPSRWFAGGKGLDDFRDGMLSNNSVSKLVDFANSNDCFPTVNIAGGISYFLYEKGFDKKCEIINMKNGKIKSVAKRNLNDYDILVRDNIAHNIIQKVLCFSELTMNNRVHSRNSFNLSSNYRGKKQNNNNDYLVLSSNGFSYINPSEIHISEKLLLSYKVIITYAMSGGNKPSSDGKYQIVSSLMILKPKEICTESFLVLDTFNNERAAFILKSYVKTKFFRFLLLQSLSSIHITKESFRFVPIQDYSRPWTDIDLYKKYKLTLNEINYIENMIKPL